MHVALAQRKFAFSQLREYARQEDLVTSMVLGTLKYLPPDQVASLFSSALDIPTTPDSVRDTLSNLRAFSTDVGLRMTVDFWPNQAASGRIEPDALFEFQTVRAPTSQVTLMIECKWNSRQSNPNQLRIQGQTVPRGERHSWIHVYLVKSLADGLNEIGTTTGSNDRLTWQSRVCVLTWRHLIEASLPETTPAVADWQRDLRSALAALGIFGFHGYLDTASQAIETVPGRVFWHDMRGYGWIGVTPIRSSASPMFWRGNPRFRELARTKVRAQEFSYWQSPRNVAG